jgi:Uma2 family endonuclease
MDTIVLKTDSLHMDEKEFFHFCQENRELRMERDRNQNIFIMSPSSYETSLINNKLSYQLTRWNESVNLGDVFESNAGFTLPNGAVRSPDVSWITKERTLKLTKYDREHFAHICPDFVIELKSLSDSLKQQKEKMEEWIENGCRLGWLVVPDEKKVFVYRQDGSQTSIDFKDNISGENVLPGFELDLSFIEKIK